MRRQWQEAVETEVTRCREERDFAAAAENLGLGDGWAAERNLGWTIYNAWVVQLYSGWLFSVVRAVRVIRVTGVQTRNSYTKFGFWEMAPEVASGFLDFGFFGLGSGFSGLGFG